MKKICTICGDDDMGKCTPQANCLNVSLEMEMKANTIKPTAFHKWLMKITGGDAVMLAEQLTHEVVNNQNPQAFDLLEATGDKHYTPQTFLKASELLRTICA